MSTLFLSGAPLSSGYSRRSNSVRAPSVHGGAGGRNVRVSYASNTRSGFDLSSAVAGGDNDVGVSVDGKATMQNLNYRLASYLAKVRSLESANAQLEHQIRKWYEKQTPKVRDYSKYESIIADLRKKINAVTVDNAKHILQIDNAKLAAEDFKIKFDSEMAMRMSAEGDIAGLKKVLDELTLICSDLEMQIEGLKEELVYLKKNHEEELAAMRGQMSSSSVNVEVDAAPQHDLASIMEAIRGQYEGMVNKNRRDMETWYNAKFEEMNKKVATSTEGLQTSRSEITELKRTLQALQIELQSQLSLKAALEGQLGETENRYTVKLNQLQAMVNSLETELGHVKNDIERQANEYKMLLNIKARLEMEIAEYRRLLDGEDVTKTVVKKVEHEVKSSQPASQPKVTKRTRVVIEEIIDGKVVSRTEDLDEKLVNQ